jgi:nucleoid-associated protein YgaU
MTEPRPFALALVLLLGLGGLAGAWALGLGAANDEPAAVVAPSPSPSAAATASPTPDGSATPRPVEHRYIVRNGDTLREIARELYGDEGKWTVILEANRSVIPDPDNLTVGTSLLIPQP